MSATSARPSPDRSRAVALGVLATGMLMVILDGSIVTVAMPAIRDDLGFSSAGLSWVVNAYLLAFGGLLLLAGRLGDLFGRKRVFLAGTAVFTAASVVAGAATSPAMLIAGRLSQGVGSAMTAGVSLGILVTLFPAPAERAKAIAVYSFTGAAGASLGQVLGGVLTDALDWHWIFFINLPIGLATLAVARTALPSGSGRGSAADVDALGAVLVTGGLMLSLYSVVKVGEHGWLSAHTLGLGAGGLALLAAFFVRQATARTPLLPLRVLRSPGVAGAGAVLILMVAALYAFQVLVAQYMQEVLGYGAARTGLAMLPAAVAIGTLSLGASARLSARFGERRVLLTGLASLIAMLALLSRIPVEGHYVRDLLPVMLFAAGFGLALPALTSLGMSGAREDDAGLASGLFNTMQQVGMALGVALLSTLAASRTENLTAAGKLPEAALTGGYRLAFTVGTGLLVTAFAATFLLLRPGRAAPARIAEVSAAEAPNAGPLTAEAPNAEAPAAELPAAELPATEAGPVTTPRAVASRAGAGDTRTL